MVDGLALAYWFAEFVFIFLFFLLGWQGVGPKNMHNRLLRGSLGVIKEGRCYDFKENESRGMNGLFQFS